MKEVNLGSKTEIEDLAELVAEGQRHLEALDVTLGDIKVPVRKQNPAVLEAIQNLLGPQYINDNGESFVTFEMFTQCMKILKNVGRATAAEFA